MYWPRPPAPIAAAMVAEPTPTTAGDADARRRSTAAPAAARPAAAAARRHAHRDAGFADRAVDAGDADDGRPHDRQQRVEHQHHERGAGADAADERHRQQEAEHRQARNRLDDVGDADQRRRQPGTPRREDAERHADGHGDRGRDRHEQHVLADQRRQLVLMSEPEPDDVGHARDASAAAGGVEHDGLDAAAARARRRPGESPRPDHSQIRRPASRTPMRSASAIASARSCVTRRTVLRSRACRRAELPLQLPPRDRIERAEGLVHQQHRRIGGERPGDADALTLAARQLVGPSTGVVPVGQPDQVEQLAHARPDPRGDPSPRAAAPRRCCPRRSGAGTARRPGSRSRPRGAAGWRPTPACHGPGRARGRCREGAGG